MTKKSYVGNLLAANPLNPKDSLDHSVVLIVSHSDGMALGLQLNRPMIDLTMADIGDQVGIYLDSEDPIFYGGSMNPNKIHMVHSNDWSGLTTVQLNDEISLTNDISVLAAISQGEGPEYYKACAGFWIWENDRLEQQLEAKPRSKVKHRWEMAPATIKNVFEAGATTDQWHRVIEDAAKHQISAWF